MVSNRNDINAGNADDYILQDSKQGCNPSDSAEIASSDACQEAAATLGYSWKGGYNNWRKPKGCFVQFNKKGKGIARFNTNAVGRVSKNLKSICKKLTAASGSTESNKESDNDSEDSLFSGYEQHQGVGSGNAALGQSILIEDVYS